jgi:HAE1 family hydrophobic/amphiphilic exporter-1
MLVGLYSPRGTRNAEFLANYAYINLNDPIARLPGVGHAQVFGAAQYAMRLWVKPDHLAELGITDIVNAIQSQNTVNPAGQIGGALWLRRNEADCPARRRSPVHSLRR